MRWFIIIAAIGGLMLAGCGSAQATVCTEDMPCFNWATMGNHKRGVQVWHGDIVVTKVVGPCQFARLKRIDSTSAKLRGDNWARRNGCK